MTHYRLQMGKIHARKRFYSIASVMKRVPGNPLTYLLMNYGHIKQVRVEARRIDRLKSVLIERQTLLIDSFSACWPI